MEAHAIPAMLESESSLDSSTSLESDDTSTTESISLPMYALALREVFLRSDQDLEGFYEEDLDAYLEEEFPFLLKNFFVFFSSSDP